ncbi:MAG: GNAT family N-acetyltransferase [Burkholderiales bacterium]|nr:GNAT family N-acetyltransferase [Burkholderiales bacterium]
MFNSELRVRTERAPASAAGDPAATGDVEHVHRLLDGRCVTLRPIRASDAPAERGFLNALSPESRYLRFHQWVAAPSDKLVHFLTDIDHAAHVAYVCVAPGGDGEQIVGEGRFIVEPGTRRCEFGIVIADSWHKSGIAGLLMHTLIETARARGLTHMEGAVLRSNRGMLRFARALGFRVLSDPTDRESVRIVKPLG